MIILFVVEDIQGLGKVESAQELGRRQGGWVAGPHLTPRGKLDGGGVGPDTQRGVPQVGRATKGLVGQPLKGYLKSDGECPG